MTTKRKGEISAICSAVKRVREVSGQSLEKFAQRAEISMSSISRFELGKKEPRDPGVLLRLALVAEQVAGCEDEMKLFLAAQDQALKGRSDDDWVIPNVIRQRDMSKLGSLAGATLVAYSPLMFRLMAAIPVVALHHPDRIEAVVAALGPGLEPVDDELRTAGNAFYYAPEVSQPRIMRLAEERALAELKNETESKKK